MTRATAQSRQSRQAAFLEVYRQTGNVWRSCNDTGVQRSSIYQWQEHDEQFVLAMKVAEAEAIERLEEEARRRAYDGCTREKGVYYKGEKVGSEIITDYSDTLLTLLLKANRPEKYKERLEVSQPPVKAYAGVDLEQV